MSTLKRKASALQGLSSDSDTDNDAPILAPVITKKSRTSNTLPTSLTAADLAALSTQELIGRILELQETLKETQTQLKSEKDNVKGLKKSDKQTVLLSSSGNGIGNGVEKEWSEEKVAERADKLADMTAKGIKKQMKWQPSCKRGTSKFSHEGVAPNAQVFFNMLDLPADGKPWKQKKLLLSDFEDAVGSIEASIRYGSLRITSQHVNVKWDAEVNSFTISGTYGL